jgi:[ribosomal protein S18]-alanine N-acetyltransferase
MTFKIRPLRSSDLRQVLAIEQSVFPEDAWTEETFAGELTQPATRYYIVAEAEGLVAGYAGLAAIPGDCGDVQTIAVRADRQGQGIGTAMLGDLIATAAARRCREVFLEVRADNDRARLLYQRTGFTEVGLRRGYYQPSGADAIVMRLRLPAGAQPDAAGRR